VKLKGSLTLATGLKGGMTCGWEAVSTCVLAEVEERVGWIEVVSLSTGCHYAHTQILKDNLK
jgi:hypothetical protein